jgi:rhodanese-related sulfurtransferase/rubrerythrin
VKWKQFLTPVTKLTADDLRSFLDERAPDTFTLLDVREPKEYQARHLPGARLMPSGQVSERFGELDPGQPTVVYCAVGGRSRAASQFLSGRGFREVYNLAGGLKAWDGAAAFGPPETGLTDLSGSETEGDFLIWAYSQEKGLEEFYRTMGRQVASAEAAALFTTLADVEDKHQLRVFEMYRRFDPARDTIERFEAGIDPATLEGGLTTEQYLDHYRPHLETPAEVVMLAMAIETQALDLYHRYADLAAGEQVRRAALALAAEERGHLRQLAALLDRVS